MSLIDEVDNLYEQAVTAPDSVNEQMLTDWAEGVASGYEVDRNGAKFARRCLSSARKLAAFWVDREPGDDDPSGWTSRVDLALGIRAWRPQLDLARHLLDVAPSSEMYDRVAVLFRVVNNEEFLDGMSYDEWLSQS